MTFRVANFSYKSSTEKKTYFSREETMFECKMTTLLTTFPIRQGLLNKQTEHFIQYIFLKFQLGGHWEDPRSTLVLINIPMYFT